MKKGPLIGAGAVALVALWAWVLQPGLTPTERLLVNRHATQDFSALGWSTADPAGRAGMLKDLLRRHDFLGRPATAIEALLGPSTCYAGTEQIPCYRLDFGGGDPRDLVFLVNLDGGPARVTRIGLTAR